MKPVLKKERGLEAHRYHLLALVLFVLLLSGSLLAYKELDAGQQTLRLPFKAGASGPPHLSVASGFYKEPFLLHITPDEPGAVIYYTLDGSVPDRSSLQYTGPIPVYSRAEEPNALSEIHNSPVFLAPLEPVFKGTVVRAIAVLHDSIASKEAVATYFIDPKGRDRYQLTVISLVVPPDSFFGHRRGIYVSGITSYSKKFCIRNNICIANYKVGFPANYKRRGKAWEREVHLSFFEPHSNKAHAFKAGARIHGHATRERPQKSFSIHLDGPKEPTALGFPLFGPGWEEPVQTFLLRNSGQDMYKARLRDAFLEEVLKGRTTIGLQAYRPAVLFINGEYWGMYDIRQRIDQHYFEGAYKVPSDSITIIGSKMQLEYGAESDREELFHLATFITDRDLQLRENYAYVTGRLDVDNLIDYVIAEVFSANSDWPQNNTCFWRYRRSTHTLDSGVRDGRWRCVMFDVDLALGASYSASFDMLQYLLKSEGIGRLFKGLMRSAAFRQRFFDRFDQSLKTTFNPQRTKSILNRMVREIAPEMQEHIDRWRTLPSLAAWQREVALIREFLDTRPYFQEQQLRKLKESYPKQQPQESSLRNIIGSGVTPSPIP